jgi:hypothetical protein
MEDQEEAKAITRSDLEAAFESAPVCWSWNSKAPKELNFSVDNKSNTPVYKKFPFAEAARFLVATKVCSGYTYWELASEIASGSGNTRRISVVEQVHKKGTRAKTLAITWKTITLESAKEAVRAYNQQKWTDTDGDGRYVSRSNLDIDTEARALFAQGLGRNAEEVQQPVRFIGRGGGWGYGGVAGYQVALTLAPAIAADIHKNRAEYEHAALSAAPLARQIPNRNTIETLFQPFVKPLVEKNGRMKKNWLVWASKFWHFLNPEAFPIEDSRVDVFFGVTLMQPVEAYLDFCRKLKSFADSHQDWLVELRQVDDGKSWCDNKLWDKMCYSLPDLNSQ